MFARPVILGLVAMLAGTPACAEGTAIPENAEIPADQLAWATACEDWDEWEKPAPPFRVHGKTYHVGTCGISAILVTTDAGHILIDTGTEGGALLVADNIAQLGFKLEDVRYILSSHEHFDHVGGMALLQDMTGAQVLASPAAAAALQTGDVSDEDPQNDSHRPMAPVKVDRILEDNMIVELGDARLLAFPTPGHTPGALSWRWQSCEDGSCQEIVYADSLSPVSDDGYRFSDHAFYLRSYRDGLARLWINGVMGCDILLTPHPSASGMRDKLLAGDLGAEPTCTAYANSITARLDARLAEEAEGNP